MADPWFRHFVGISIEEKTEKIQILTTGLLGKTQTDWVLKVSTRLDEAMIFSDQRGKSQICSNFLLAKFKEKIFK